MTRAATRWDTNLKLCRCACQGRRGRCHCPITELVGEDRRVCARCENPKCAEVTARKDENNRERQRRWFRRQQELLRELERESRRVWA
jgi:hypothetical protein